MLVIPANLNSNDFKFNGAFAFAISKSEIKLAAAIDHVLNPSDNFWQRNVERSLYIENFLYTKSQCLIRINRISTGYDAVKSINIPCDVK